MSPASPPIRPDDRPTPDADALRGLVLESVRGRIDDADRRLLDAETRLSMLRTPYNAAFVAPERLEEAETHARAMRADAAALRAALDYARRELK